MRRRSSRAVVAALAAAVALAVGPLPAGAANTRINNPAADKAPSITQGSPRAAGTPTGYLAVWEENLTTGGSRIGYATSTNSGAKWTDRGSIPQGQEDFLGDPELAYDAARHKWYVVTESCFPPAGKCPPNVISTGDLGATWSAPKDIYTPIQTKDKEFGTNPAIAVDANTSSPFSGRVYVAWTDFHIAPAPASSRVVIQSSNDGGVTWSAPVQVSDAPDTFAENARIGVDSSNAIVVTFLSYDPATPRYDLVVDRSTDGGATWGADRVITTNVQSSGVTRNCGNAGNRAVLNGDINSFARPELGVDTKTGNLYTTWHAPGPKTNLPDIYVSRSVDRGQTWQTPVRLGAAGDQFFPVVDVGPGSEVGVFWYDRRNDTANRKTDVYAAFSFNRGVSFGPHTRVTTVNFKTPRLNPNYDTSRPNCDSPFGIDVLFPGSGAYAIWADGRDAGPAANNGVDPNIYFVHVPVPTTTSAVVARGSTALTVTGAVAPRVAGGKLTATLYRKVGTAYAKVTAKTALLDAAGKYRLTFTRTAAGSCRLIAKFAGNAEYQPSTTTKNFTC